MTVAEAFVFHKHILFIYETLENIREKGENYVRNRWEMNFETM